MERISLLDKGRRSAGVLRDVVRAPPPPAARRLPLSPSPPVRLRGGRHASAWRCRAGVFAIGHLTTFNVKC